ncbi:uncharacterized protein LAJ45_06931 [Morchella importuna]|uniref:uncharacterized protein n=1 Tax=Morchella importuna TaxID=1174673 RepID=UPI001E8CCD52|nr:uncharacterized protein LAJ45_06931 [Morchella importuna]KAH8148956.1 hypothetical protein LAJ45_06931 [Morchella importuna]
MFVIRLMCCNLHYKIVEEEIPILEISEASSFETLSLFLDKLMLSRAVLGSHLCPHHHGAWMTSLSKRIKL